MTDWSLAPNVDALVEGATQRTPMTSTDSKSGARFERVVIDGQPYVLKHVDRRDDWIMRQTGDVGCWPVRVWETGVLALVPPCIDHTLVGAARAGAGGAVLMRDVGRWMVPAGDTPLTLDQHRQFLAHLATFHAATWGWVDDVGLLPLGNRYFFFSPTALACERGRGGLDGVPRLAVDGWQRLAVVDPDMHAHLMALHDDPWPLIDALQATPCAVLHGDWKLGNLGSMPDGRTVLVDWSLPGSGPVTAELAHYLALNSRRLPVGHTKDDAIDVYRRALEDQGVNTDRWFEHQLALSLLAVMLQLGWEKSFDEVGDERAWWSARVRDGVEVLEMPARR